MRVFITGVGGFIGGELARYLYSKGAIVRGSSHDVAKLGAVVEMLERAFEFDFLSEIDPVWFEGCDAVVHCAYDPRPASRKKNIEGMTRICSAAMQAGVTHQLFISSHSARSDAVSEYGKQKYEIERIFLGRGLTVVRPGLVIGNGGLFRANRKLMLSAPILILPGADVFPVFYVSLRDLLFSISKIIDGKMLGEYNIFNAEAALLRDFSQAVLAAKGNKRVVLSLPLNISKVLGTLLAKLHLNTPTLFDSVATAYLNVASPVHHTHIFRFVDAPLSLDHALKLVDDRHYA